MKQTGIIAAVITALALLIVFQNAWAERALPEEEAPRADFLAPSFELEGKDGRTYSVVGGERREKALLINFWASWCGPCQEEAPDLMYLYDKYGDKLDIYGVNALLFDQRKDVDAFVNEYGLTFPILLDEKNKVTDLYNVFGFPTTFLVDRRGVVEEVVWGILPLQQLEDKVKRLIR